MMLYAIDAVDTFFFRNASPFDADLSQSASSMFPPPSHCLCRGVALC